MIELIMINSINNKQTVIDPNLIKTTSEENSIREEPSTSFISMSLLDGTVVGSAQRVYDLFVDYDHPSKRHKYRVVLNDFERNLQRELQSIEGVWCIWKQRAESSSSPLADIIANFLTTIHSKTASRYTNQREHYKNFIQQLRDLCKALQEEDRDPYFKEAETFCDTCSLIRWGQISIWGYMKEILQIFTAHGEKPLSFYLPKTLEELPEALQEINQIIKSAPPEVGKPPIALNAQKLLGTLDLKDFTGTENTPRLRSVLSYKKGTDKKDIPFLQHACPTFGKDIVGDYQAFIQAVARKEGSILYVNHQAIFPKGLIDETTRTNAICALQENHANFFELAQPLEGEHFEQKGTFERMRTFEELKSSLLEEFKIEARCRLPKNLENRDFYEKEVLPDLLNKTHKFFFPHQTEIKQGEWQTFILVFYVLQSSDLKLRLPNVQYYTTPCKDFLDRGGAMALIEEVLFAGFLREKPITEEELEWILVNTLASPILVKKQEMIPHRLKLGLQVIKHLNQLSLKQKQSLKKLDFFEGWKPDTFTVQRIPGQEGLPTLEESRTDEELLIALKRISSPTWQPLFWEDNQYNEEKIFEQLDQVRPMTWTVNNELVTDVVEVDGFDLIEIEQAGTRKILLEKLNHTQLTQEEKVQFLTVFQRNGLAILSEQLHSIFCETDFFSSEKPNSPLSVQVDTNVKTAAYSASFFLKCKDPESLFYRDEGPYPEIQAELRYDLSNGKAEWLWKII